jgi:predicted nucleic acid-binding protein
MIAIDANIFVYSLDDSVPVKHAQAKTFLANLLRDDVTPRLMWQAACETLGWLRRRKSEGRFTAAEVTSRFQTLAQAYPLTLPEEDVLHLSFGLQERYSLSHWDSLLIAACISAGVDTLYSEDMSHGAKYDSVTVINPFLAT